MVQSLSVVAKSEGAEVSWAIYIILERRDGGRVFHAQWFEDSTKNATYLTGRRAVAENKDAAAGIGTEKMFGLPGLGIRARSS